jgi:hypothetical protein
VPWHELCTLVGKVNKMNTLQRSGGTVALFMALAMSVSGCAAIEGIFKAGLWVGVIAVVLVLGLVGGAVALLKR